ncbi:MAG: hypothetical protein FWH02_05755 [Oscillospiraceae bacterium]|nr:hypothetical protein [Oscillospiraceae bacterium]
MKYVIGMDAGSTKTHLAIFTEQGKKIDLCAWGPLNHEGLPGSFAQLEDELGQFIGGSLEKNGIMLTDIRLGVFGLAGVDTTAQHATISDIILRIGIKDFTLFNDGFLGIPAGSGSGVGICAINGSGESIFGLAEDGRTFQIGGVGYVSSDMGGGYNLGRSVVSAVYRELFRMGEPTALTEMLFRELGITDKYDFVETIYRKTDDGTYNAGRLNPLLIDAAGQNDPVAAGLVRQIGHNYAGGIACMAKELAFPEDKPLDVVLAGSVFVKNEGTSLRDVMCERVCELLPKHTVRFTLFDKPPVAGAIVWALKCLHGTADKDDVYKQI